MEFTWPIQRSPLFCANIVKKDPGRARQNSLATAGTNFTKPGAHNKGDLCMFILIRSCGISKEPQVDDSISFKSSVRQNF